MENVSVDQPSDFLIGHSEGVELARKAAGLTALEVGRIASAYYDRACTSMSLNKNDFIRGVISGYQNFENGLVS